MFPVTGLRVRSVHALAFQGRALARSRRWGACAFVADTRLNWMTLISIYANFSRIVKTPATRFSLNISPKLIKYSHLGS